MFKGLNVNAHFDKMPNGRRSPTIRKMRGKSSISGKSKAINLMGQHGKNDRQ